MRRVLFDENLPRLLRRSLAGFEIRTVQEEGWGSFRGIGVVVIVTPRLQLRLLEGVADELRTALGSVKPGEVIHVTIPVSHL